MVNAEEVSTLDVEQLYSPDLTLPQCVGDVSQWAPSGDLSIVAQGKRIFTGGLIVRSCQAGILNCIRALGGYTYAESPAAAFDTEIFNENEYFTRVSEACGTPDVALSW